MISLKVPTVGPFLWPEPETRAAVKMLMSVEWKKASPSDMISLEM